MTSDSSSLDRRTILMSGAAALAALAAPIAAQQSPAVQSIATPPNTSLAGKVAVITGSARAIGRAIALDMAAAGADIALIDIAAIASPVVEYAAATPDDLATTARLVKEKGRRVVAITADTRDLAALRKASEEILSQLGRIDIVVANAAIQSFAPILEMSDAQWHDVIDVNIHGTVNTVRAFAPHLVKQGGGRIIITSSGQGRHGMKHGSAYSASKWALIGFMKSAALELGKYKITVNTIEPGLIDTPMTRNKRRWQEAIAEAFGDPPPENPTEEEVKKARLIHAPLGVPWMTPEQVAPAATFLASDAAAMVTGASYDITAGDSAHYTA